MDNEKEKDIVFKPSNWLYVFLFIYYSIWLLQSFGAVSYYITFGIDSFLTYGLVEWLSFGLFILAGVYSFYAVIKTLRGDKDCITSLKWSLVSVFCYTLMDPTRGQIPTYNIWTWCAVFLVRPLFYLIFYLYLCFAKGVKRRFPKSERIFGPSGWVWSGLVVAFLCVGVYSGWQQYEISQYCRPVDAKTLILAPGEVCDGYVLFKTDRKWDIWAEPSDTLYIEDRIEIFPTMMSVDSLSRIYIASGRCDKHDARTYNQVIVASLGSFSSREEGYSGKLKEVFFNDTIVSGNRLMSTVFKTTEDSIPTYFDVLLITEATSPKCCVMVKCDKKTIDAKWAIGITNNLRFDLQNVTKSKNNENTDNSKNKQADRTAKSKYQSNTDMPASLFQCICPRHLFSIVTLKYNEREITYRKCDYIF